MERITLCLWFDGQAENAARFYGSAFGSFAMGRVTRYDKVFAEVSGQPEGSVMTVSFELDGYELVGLNGGPRFDFTPAVSLHVGCESEEEVDRLHETLSDEGEILMPLQEYPFSPKYCWLSDRHGLSWQIDLAPRPQRITPALLFVGEQAGRAEEAVELYTSLFDGSEIHALERWEPGDPDPGRAR